MTTIEKIEKLNKLCKNTLSISHFKEWEISSFGNGTYLNMNLKYPYLKNKSLRMLVNEAYDYVLDEIYSDKETKEAIKLLKENGYKIIKTK